MPLNTFTYVLTGLYSVLLAQRIEVRHLAKSPLVILYNGDAENAGVENERVENAGGDCSKYGKPI